MAPLVAFIPLIAAGVGAAVTGVELANQPSAPKAPTQISSETMQAREQQAASIAQAQALKDRRGMASTVLTSPLGTQAPAQTQSATLGT
jgi:hypothetical protein